jgi:hypothetical protein
VKTSLDEACLILLLMDWKYIKFRQWHAVKYTLQAVEETEMYVLPRKDLDGFYRKTNLVSEVKVVQFSYK